MFKLKSSFNVTSLRKITTAVVRRAVRSILSKICTTWYKIALSRVRCATHFPVGLFDGFVINAICVCYK